MTLRIISPHLGDRWKLLQKRFINDFTPTKYDLIQYVVSPGCHHLRALGRCLETIRQRAQPGDLIVEMDSDAFPFKINWVGKIKQYLDEGNEFVAVQRLENPYHYKDIAHPCFCAWYYGTEIVFKTIANNPFIDGYRKRKWKKLHRTNSVNLHRQMFGIYDNMVYHHGAGSRDVRREGFFKNGLKKQGQFFVDPYKFILGIT